MSTLNLTSGYHEIPIREKDIPKAAIIEPSGSYAFKCMALGLPSAPRRFQRLMDNVLPPVLRNSALVVFLYTIIVNP